MKRKPTPHSTGSVAGRRYCLRLDAVVFAATLRTPPGRPSAIGDRAAARTPLSAGGAARADMLRCVGRCERGRGRPRPGAALVPTETERDFLRRRRG
jgi:hypothetical protein